MHDSFRWSRGFDEVIHVGARLITLSLGSREQPALYLFGALFTNYQMSDGKLADQLFHQHELCYGMHSPTRLRTLLHRETHFMKSSYYFSKNAFNVISVLQFDTVSFFAKLLFTVLLCFEDIFALWKPWPSAMKKCYITLALSLAQLRNTKL